jgi:hypothetical protein
MAEKPVAVFMTARPVPIDACASCRLFWFDQYESTSLTPRSTLGLFQYVGSVAGERITPLASRFNCPRCESALEPTKDLQRTTAFTYWRCAFNHGRLISFNQFLREKNFIRTPSPAELARLRETIRQVSCSQCGAPVDLAGGSACSHCGAPIALIDPDSVAKALQQLAAAEAGAAAGTGTNRPQSSTAAGAATGAAFNDAQIAALFDHERARLHPGHEESIDVLAVGVQAIGAMVGAFLSLS